MISNDCTGSCKFNYHTTTTAQVQLRWKVIVLLILMEFMIITVYKISFHIIQWKELVCWKYVFCWGSLDGICISCEVPSIADTTLGISEQYLFLLPSDWDGWPLNSHNIFINYIKFPLLRPNQNFNFYQFHSLKSTSNGQMMDHKFVYVVHWKCVLSRA